MKEKTLSFELKKAKIDKEIYDLKTMSRRPGKTVGYIVNLLHSNVKLSPENVQFIGYQSAISYAKKHGRAIPDYMKIKVKKFKNLVNTYKEEDYDVVDAEFTKFMRLHA